MAQILSVRLTKIDLHKATFQAFDVQNYIRFTMEFDNKGIKDITGLKGIASFKDKFGDTVSEVPIKVEQNLPAGQMVAVDLSKPFNQFEEADRRLANIDLSSVQFIVSPKVILFSDGSKFEAPKAQD